MHKQEVLQVDSKSPKAPRGTVLLVDDDTQVLDAYARILRKAGFTVDAVSDGRFVEAALEGHEFDVVISDVRMPHVNGIEVLKSVHERHPDLPIVLMTGNGDLKTAVSALEHGAVRFLLKPVAPVGLTAAADEAIRLGRMAKVKRQAFELYGNAAKQTSDRDALSRRFDSAISAIEMVYQPIVRWSDQKVYAYEALVRTGETSLARPDFLFTAADQLGRVHELGRAIRAQIAGTIMRRGVGPAIFVNVHPNELSDDELLSADAPLSKVASSVVLEVTERLPLNEIVDVSARFETLRRLGFRLAIDDLGAGYAGLTSFAQINPQVVKLDMSLTRGCDAEPTKRKLIGSMITLCRDLGILVVAEGVETIAERDVLVAIGCDLLQGYLFAKPGPPFPSVFPATP